MSPAQIGTEASAGYPVARLKKGVSLATANAQLKIVSARMSSRFAGWMSGGEIRAFSLETHFGDLDRALLILIGAVGFVLLIACVNVSGLLLARGWARQREIAIREALGASCWRIVRQFLTESILLAIGGGALGLLFAVWGVHVLRVITPNGPEHGHFELNANILWFTIAVSLLTGILFGLAPALQASTRRLGAAIRDGFSSLVGISSRRTGRLRSALVVVEIALAVILVIGATLVARSFQKLMSVKLGFRTDHIVTMEADFGNSVCNRKNLKTLPGCKAAIFDVLRRMQSISGVQSAAVASDIPLNGWSFAAEIKVEGRAHEITIGNGARIGIRFVSPDYFRTFGIPVLSGRSFTDVDTIISEPVAIVDQEFAKRFVNGEPLGRRISFFSSKSTTGWDKPMPIVGVVGTANDADLELPLSGEIYIPYAQSDHLLWANFIARTSENPAMMIPALRRAIWSEDKNAPITEVYTMDQLVALNVAEPKFQALLLGSFGAFGLILAMVGIYGVISYGVTQRTHEIGIRMALGAEKRNILGMIIGQGLRLAIAGLIIGAIAALILTRVLVSFSHLLYGVEADDPLTFVAVGALLIFIALVACWIPARRAMRVEPMEALRYE